VLTPLLLFELAFNGILAKKTSPMTFFITPTWKKTTRTRSSNRSNWTFGDEESSWDRASTLADPTGPDFLNYRGVLNQNVADAIKQSSLEFG
jgi:hypothetical protein